MNQPNGWCTPSPSIVWQVSIATGRLASSPFLHLDTGPIQRVFLDWLGRIMILLQRSRSWYRTRVTQSELTLFRAPYPLDQQASIMITYKYFSCSSHNPKLYIFALFGCVGIKKSAVYGCETLISAGDHTVLPEK